MANTANISSLSVAELNELLANIVANSALTTDFNVTPYYDDYTEDKNFYRILYKPGYAVQARELTQQQTILQKQIDRFGRHVFREGSIVIPGQFGIELNTDYVKIKDVDNANNSVDVSDFVNQTITGLTNGVSAYVIDVAEGTEAETDTKTLFVRYLSGSSSNTQIKTFVENEILTANTDTPFNAISLSSSATGKGSRFIIQEGVIFAKEHFVSFPTSSIVLSRYSTSPTCRVGFDVFEEIITANEDASLLDPALESSNFSAPGADRFKLTPTLRVLDIDDNRGFPDFVELFTINDGVITEIYDRPQYNILRDELAKRTSDESGDYYVNGLNVRVRENLLSGINDGFSPSGNSSLLSVGVEPGLAYVKGYEIGIVGNTHYLTITKSDTYQNIASQIGTGTMGDYVHCNEYVGNIEHDRGTIVLLKDVPNRRITTFQGAATSGSGNTIGTARVLSVEYNSGILGTPSGNVNIYLTDIKMNGVNAFTSTKSISGTDFGADIVLENNNAILKESSSRILLYYTGTNYTRTVRNSSGTGSMIFNFKRTVPVSISSTGTFSVSIATAGETFPYGTTADLSDSDRRDMILTLDSNANIAGPGVALSASGNTLTGDASSEFTNFNVGDKIEFSGNSTTYIITRIDSDTSLVVDGDLPSISSNTYFKAYKDGDVIDLTSKSFDDGSERSVSTTSTQLSFDLNESFGGSGVTGELTYQAVRTGGESAGKSLNANRYVSINCASAGVTGPFNLGFSDIYQIRNVIKKTGSAPSSLSDGTDVTSSFVLDNGQRDNMYDHGSITPNGTSLGATDFLLVRLDYFTPGTFSGGKGFFSIDSYPIDDTTTSNTSIRTENVPIFTSPQSGSRYDLRNYIDFRPIKTATAADATTVGAATENPASSGDFASETNGLRLIAPSTQFSHSYSYYEARRDIVVIDKDKNIKVISSNPSQSPVTPLTPENTMALATIFVAPYPSLAPNYAQRINRKDLACVVKKVSNIRYTMRNIGILERRIENLEYFASLNLLEKSAIDLKVLDENGLDRFKNGIFVDTFANHLLGDRLNSDYRIVVDPFEKTIRPTYTMNSLYYDYLPSSSGVVKTGDLITLPYSQNAFITQPRVSTYRNVEYTSYRFIGNMYLFPDTDVWVDVYYAPDEQITIGPDANNLPQSGLTTTWNSWQTSVTGYHISGSTSAFGLVRPAENLTLNEFNSLVSSTRTGTLISSPNSLADQQVTELSSSVRTGTETYVSGVTETVETVGSKLIDASLIPYIRPQTIYIAVQGLKANTKFYTFFDGEDMTSYVTQITGYTGSAPFDWNPSSNTNISTDNPVSASQPFVPISVITKNEGDDLIADVNGTVYFALRLPIDKRFRVGTKEVKVTDSPTNSTSDASSSATAYFVSQGLLQQKQNTVLTTREVIQSQREVTESTQQSKVIGFIDNPSCTAYSFIPKAPDGEEGLFLTSVDLYFARKHPTLGVWIEIREMDNSGGITRNAVPLSEVWYSADQINISDDASLATNFKFRSPLFLYNNVQYALVIHTVGLNPDTYLWISRLGETDIKTGTKINSRPLTGTYYTTNNNLNWDIVPDIDLLVTFYRASFTKNSTGTAILGNRPIENLILGNVSSSLLTYGEQLQGRSRLTMTGNTSVINIGDFLIGQTSGANSAVISNTGPVIVANTRYQIGERVDIRSSAGSLRTETSIVSAASTAGGVLSNYNVRGGVIKIEVLSSNGNFILADTITGQTSGDTATVDGIANLRYSVVDFEPSYLGFNKTTINFEMQTTSNTGSIGTYVKVNEGSNYYFDTEKAVLSKSFEGPTRSNNVRISMATTTDFISPVVDLSRTHSVYVDNIINANTTGESANSSGGGLFNKYISQIITLAEGQDAEDLSVILTAYRPPTTDVKVYVKILNNEDGEQFNQQNWIEMEKVDDSAYSSLSNRNDFREFSYKFPTSSLTGPNGEVQYVNRSDVTFTGFKYYQIKIGLTATNSAVVPRVGDLRVLALQI